MKTLRPLRLLGEVFLIVGLVIFTTVTLGLAARDHIPDVIVFGVFAIAAFTGDNNLRKGQ